MKIGTLMQNSVQKQKIITPHNRIKVTQTEPLCMDPKPKAQAHNSLLENRKDVSLHSEAWACMLASLQDTKLLKTHNIASIGRGNYDNSKIPFLVV
jgi:hypothetical protein